MIIYKKYTNIKGRGKKIFWWWQTHKRWPIITQGKQRKVTGGRGGEGGWLQPLNSPLEDLWSNSLPSRPFHPVRPVACEGHILHLRLTLIESSFHHAGPAHSRHPPVCTTLMAAMQAWRVFSVHPPAHASRSSPLRIVTLNASEPHPTPPPKPLRCYSNAQVSRPPPTPHFSLSHLSIELHAFAFFSESFVILSSGCAYTSNLFKSLCFACK